MTQSEKVTAICKILKERFTNLTVEDTVNLAFKILEAVEK